MKMVLAEVPVPHDEVHPAVAAATRLVLGQWEPPQGSAAALVGAAMEQTPPLRHSLRAACMHGMWPQHHVEAMVDECPARVCELLHAWHARAMADHTACVVQQAGEAFYNRLAGIVAQRLHSEPHTLSPTVAASLNDLVCRQGKPTDSRMHGALVFLLRQLRSPSPAVELSFGQLKVLYPVVHRSTLA